MLLNVIARSGEQCCGLAQHLGPAACRLGGSLNNVKIMQGTKVNGALIVTYLMQRKRCERMSLFCVPTR